MAKIINSPLTALSKEPVRKEMPQDDLPTLTQREITILKIAQDAVALNTELLAELKEGRAALTLRNSAGSKARGKRYLKLENKAIAISRKWESENGRPPTNKKLVQILEREEPNKKWKESTVKVWRNNDKKKRSV